MTPEEQRRIDEALFVFFLWLFDESRSPDARQFALDVVVAAHAIRTEDQANAELLPLITHAIEHADPLPLALLTYPQVGRKLTAGTFLVLGEIAIRCKAIAALVEIADAALSYAVAVPAAWVRALLEGESELRPEVGSVVTRWLELDNSDVSTLAPLLRTRPDLLRALVAADEIPF